MKRFCHPGPTVRWLTVIAALALLGLAAQAEEAAAYKPQSSRQNRVQVDVVPIQLSPGKPVKFEISMNTHSVDLSQDLLAVSTLTDDRGREYRPAGWDGSPPGGHHRSGVLVFSELAEGATSITLVIRDVADVPQRVFNWQLDR